jgi:hypothetical protein
LINKETLRKASTEVVRADFLKILLVSLVSGSSSSSADHGPDSRLLQIDIGIFRGEIVFILIPLEVTLNAVREIGIAGFPTVATGVFACPDTQPILSALGFLDVNGPNLWYLESAETDERSELNDNIVALAVRGPAEVVDLTVGEPDLVLVSSSGFDSHYDYFIFRYY